MPSACTQPRDAVKMQFKHPFVISEILIRHRLGARRLAMSWGQTLNKAEKAIESQYFMPMTDLDKGSPGHLPKLGMCHFPPMDTLICNFPSFLMNQ